MTGGRISRGPVAVRAGWRPTRDAPGRPSPSRRSRRIVAALAAFVVVWVGVGIAVRLVYAGRVLPGTQVTDVSLGGLDPNEARRRLASATEDRAVTLMFERRRFNVHARDVGFRIDAGRTVARAMAAGRHGPLRGLWSDISALWAPRTVRPVYASQGRRIDAVVASIARRIDRRPFRGSLSIDPGTLRVSSKAPRPGRTLDQRRAAAGVLETLRRGGGSVVAPVRTQPGVASVVVEAVARQAERYLDAPLRLSGTGAPVKLTPRQLAPILAVEKVNDGGRPRVRLGVQRERLAELVDAVAAKRDRDPVDARILASARTVVLDEKLDLGWKPRPANVRVVAGRAGRVVRRTAATDAIAAAVRKGRHATRLPVRTVSAAVPTTDARKVTSLIGTFTTHFICCQPRVTNIRLIAKAVDGTVIAKGEQFALNRVAGRRTRAKGYVPAPFISNGKLIPSVGGGVSQFSTTTYNAAYFAGLHIDFHQPHSEYIDRYPPGREATLNYPTIDLTWTNDTKAPVLVRAASTATSVSVSLYGDNGGRRVRADSSPRRPLPGRDFAVTVTRTIRYPDGRTTRQPYTTSYDTAPAG